MQPVIIHKFHQLIRSFPGSQGTWCCCCASINCINWATCEIQAGPRAKSRTWKPSYPPGVTQRPHPEMGSWGCSCGSLPYHVMVKRQWGIGFTEIGCTRNPTLQDLIFQVIHGYEVVAFVTFEQDSYVPCAWSIRIISHYIPMVAGSVRAFYQAQKSGVSLRYSKSQRQILSE